MSLMLESDPKVWSISKEVCSHCSEKLAYCEETVEYGMSLYVTGKNGECLTIPYLDEEEGDFYYEPHFLHYSCWEKMVEELYEAVRDELPVIEPGSHACCKFCESSIVEGEIFVSSTIGELRISRRVPAGKPVPIFEASGDPYYMCLSCALYVNEHVLECWSEDLNQVGECTECTHGRCWRTEDCSCICHTDAEEDETE